VAQPSTASPGIRSQPFDSGLLKLYDRVADKPGFVQDREAL
jgi:hypothetical protein